MTYNPEIHHCHSIRLKGYDYTQNGAYFVTIYTQNRESLFGEIMDDEIVLNNAGNMVASIWYEIPEHYPGVEIDAFQVIADHILGIILLINESNAGSNARIEEADPRVCPNDTIHNHHVCPPILHPNQGQPQGVAPTKTSTPTNSKPLS